MRKSRTCRGSLRTAWLASRMSRARSVELWSDCREFLAIYFNSCQILFALLNWHCYFLLNRKYPKSLRRTWRRSSAPSSMWLSTPSNNISTLVAAGLRRPSWKNHSSSNRFATRCLCILRPPIRSSKPSSALKRIKVTRFLFLRLYSLKQSTIAESNQHNLQWPVEPKIEFRFKFYFIFLTFWLSSNGNPIILWLSTVWSCGT